MKDQNGTVDKWEDLGRRYAASRIDLENSEIEATKKSGPLTDDERARFRKGYNLGAATDHIDRLNSLVKYLPTKQATKMLEIFNTLISEYEVKLATGAQDDE